MVVFCYHDISYYVTLLLDDVSVAMTSERHKFSLPFLTVNERRFFQKKLLASLLHRSQFLRDVDR